MCAITGARSGVFVSRHRTRALIRSTGPARPRIALRTLVSCCPLVTGGSFIAGITVRSFVAGRAFITGGPFVSDGPFIAGLTIRPFIAGGAFVSYPSVCHPNSSRSRPSALSVPSVCHPNSSRNTLMNWTINTRPPFPWSLLCHVHYGINLINGPRSSSRDGAFIADSFSVPLLK